MFQFVYIFVLSKRNNHTNIVKRKTQDLRKTVKEQKKSKIIQNKIIQVMDSLAKVLVSLRDKKTEAPVVINLPATTARKEQMPKSAFHFYMRMTQNIICL